MPQPPRQVAIARRGYDAPANGHKLLLHAQVKVSYAEFGWFSSLRR
jgi:hypothetical protein